MLSVENTKIFEQLILHKSELDSYVVYLHGVTHIKEEGVKQIARLMNLDKSTISSVKRRKKSSALTARQKEWYRLKEQCDILMRELLQIENAIRSKDAENIRLVEELLNVK